ERLELGAVARPEDLHPLAGSAAAARREEAARSDHDLVAGLFRKHVGDGRRRIGHLPQVRRSPDETGPELDASRESRTRIERLDVATALVLAERHVARRDDL